MKKFYCLVVLCFASTEARFHDKIDACTYEVTKKSKKFFRVSTNTFTKEFLGLHGTPELDYSCINYGDYICPNYTNETEGMIGGTSNSYELAEAQTLAKFYKASLSCNKPNRKIIEDALSTLEALIKSERSFDHSFQIIQSQIYTVINDKNEAFRD